MHGITESEKDIWIKHRSFPSHKTSYLGWKNKSQNNFS